MKEEIYLNAAHHTKIKILKKCKEKKVFSFYIAASFSKLEDPDILC